jgi:hypothetical protein
MKRFPTLVILFTFSLNFLGFYAYYAFRLVEIRREMKAQLQFLPEEQLNRFVFSTTEYEEVKRGDDEIQVEGRMYDIARMEIQADSVLVFALHDEAEDNLISFIQTIVKRSASDKKPLPSTVVDFFSLVYLLPDLAWVGMTVEKIKGNTQHLLVYTSFYPGLHSPPPQG